MAWHHSLWCFETSRHFRAFLCIGNNSECHSINIDNNQKYVFTIDSRASLCRCTKESDCSAAFTSRIIPWCIFGSSILIFYSAFHFSFFVSRTLYEFVFVTFIDIPHPDTCIGRLSFYKHVHTYAHPVSPNTACRFVWKNGYLQKKSFEDKSRLLTAIACRAQRNTLGYFAGYISKRQPVGAFEAEQAVKNLRYLQEKLASKSHAHEYIICFTRKRLCLTCRISK